MSRIGKKPINVPAGVTVAINGCNVEVKGPKGTLTRTIDSAVSCTLENNQVILTCNGNDKGAHAKHGLYRALINNMVVGVSEGFKRTLIINGVGYKSSVSGNKLVLNIGYSHPVEFEDTDDYTLEAPNPNTIIVKGINKQIVGQIAAVIREKRLPEPYKGKGIKYADEVIRRKEGKTGSKK